VPFAARTRGGSFRTAFGDDGIDAGVTVRDVPLTIPVAVTVGDRLYEATVGVLYSGRADRRGRFRAP
jgi:hypothetical protein